MTHQPIVPVPPLPAPVDVPGRLREAARTVTVWLVLSAVWLILNAAFWLLFPFAGLERDAPDTWMDLLVFEAIATVLTGAAVAVALPALRRGVHTVRLTLACGMLALTGAHILTLSFSALMALLAMIGGMFGQAGGRGAQVVWPLASAVGAGVLDLLLIGLGIVCAGRLFSARPPPHDAGPPMPPYPFEIR